MNVTFDKESLVETLTTASRFTSNKISASPALQSVLVKLEKDTAHFFATSLNSYFHTQQPVKNTKPETFTIEPKKITEFLSLLAPGAVEAEIDERSVVFSQGKTKGTFPQVDAKDFPPIPKTEGVKKQKLKTDLLVKNLPLAIFAASTDESRPALTAVNFVNQDDESALVSTDGFRLSLVTMEKNTILPPMLIPRDFLEEVLRFMKDEKEVEFAYAKEERVVLFSIGPHEFYSRLIEGDFPPFEKVVPDTHQTRVVLDHAEFLRNIRVASVFARDFSNIVICDFKKDGLYIKPKTDGEEQSAAFQEATLEGEEQQVAFNFKFVIDFLNHTSAKKVVVEILRPDAPTVFRLEGNKEFLHIIMPVRIQTA